MSTKIRLQRFGHKGHAFFRIVVADSRSPRDGRFIEGLGTYDPNTQPSTVNVNFDRALYWVETGAQPTDTVRNLLRREGVYMMKHLRGGVKKGAFDEETCQQKFDAWKQSKTVKIEEIRQNVVKARAESNVKALAEEKKVNEAIAKKVAEKKAAADAAVAAAQLAASVSASEPEPPAS